MNELIKNYQNNCNEWNNLHATAEENAKEFDKRIWDIKDKYREQISEIERKMYSEINTLEQEKEIKVNEIKNKKDTIAEKIKQARDIFKFICLHESGFKVETPIVYTFDRGNKTIHNPIMTIREDDHCKAYLYIITNNKPVNKFSLIMVGSCPILEPDRDTRNPLYSYGIHAHTEEKCHIMTSIKDDYTEKYLREYAEKNIKRLLKRLSSIDDLILKYQQAIDIFNTTEGKIAYYQWRKYYYENHYSNGTATPEYKAVLKKLKQLKG